MRAAAIALLAASSLSAPPPPFAVLDPAAFAPLLGADLAWAAASVPLFESSDANLTTVYFFRWRTYRTHIHATSDGAAGFPWVVTEFSPSVPWAGRDNTINCAAGHHVRDGRWMRDNATLASSGAVMDSYSLWWLSGLGGVRANYYNWLATSLLDRLNVAGDARFLARVAQFLGPLQDYVLGFAAGALPNNNNCQHFDVENDCIFSFPNCQGQEHNLAGGGCQPLVHAMMTSEAAAVARLCALAGNATCAARFAALSAQFQARTLRLWNPNISAFDTSNSTLAPRGAAPPGFSGVRELSSLSSPWYFGAVPADGASLFAASWDAAFDPEGLAGAFGLRTAEKRNPAYSCWPKDCCYWGGPVWPFESSKAITAAAGVLQSAALAPQVPQVTRARLFGMLSDYTAMHLRWTITNFSTGLRANYSLLNESGFFLPGLGDAWIAEAGCADDGSWTDNPSGGYFYEHSTFVDLVIQAVAGLVPRAAGAAPELAVQPLQPSDDALAWWCLDGALVNGRVVTVLWDADGSRYGRGAGLSVLLDGALVAHADTTQGPALVVPLS
jgi:hypothetical protein